MLKTENISFAYKTRRRTHPVFNNLNLSFKPGFNIILGPNGAGKSTLLKSIFGLLDYEGKIYYKDESVTDMTIEEKTEIMSYLPQVDVNNSMLSVLEMVLLGLLSELGRKVEKEDVNKVIEVLRSLNIEHLASRSFSELSGGQKKMVFIAQTLVKSPKIILLDEPINSLDLQKQVELFYLLDKIVKEKNTIVVVVLHDINLAARFADNIIVLDCQGELYSSGSSREVITEAMIKEVYGVISKVHYDEDMTPSVSVIKSVNEN